jgi:hypothetical protein
MQKKILMTVKSEDLLCNILEGATGCQGKGVIAVTPFGNPPISLFLCEQIQPEYTEVKNPSKTHPQQVRRKQ